HRSDGHFDSGGISGRVSRRRCSANDATLLARPRPDTGGRDGMALPGNVALIATVSWWQHHSPIDHNRTTRRTLDVCSGSTGDGTSRSVPQARQLLAELAGNRKTAPLRSEI